METFRVFGKDDTDREKEKEEETIASPISQIRFKPIYRASKGMLCVTPIVNHAIQLYASEVVRNGFKRR